MAYYAIIYQWGMMAWYPTNVGEGESERSLLIQEKERERMRSINIYEVEYSCSPGGVDCWELEENGTDFFQGDFDTAEDAISYALLKFEGKEINLNIKSLQTLQSEDKKQIREEILEKTNLILSDYTKLVKRFWDLYENIDDDQAQLLTKAGADKWLKYAFTLSMDELWHEAISWELTKEDLEMGDK